MEVSNKFVTQVLFYLINFVIQSTKSAPGFRFHLRHPETNHYVIVVRETFEVRAVSHNDFKNFENKAEFITWFISCSYGRLHISSDTLDICISEDKETRLFYNEHKQIFEFLKPKETKSVSSDSPSPYMPIEKIQKEVKVELKF